MGPTRCAHAERVGALAVGRPPARRQSLAATSQPVEEIRDGLAALYREPLPEARAVDTGRTRYVPRVTTDRGTSSRR